MTDPLVHVTGVELYNIHPLRDLSDSYEVGVRGAETGGQHIQGQGEL